MSLHWKFNSIFSLVFVTQGRLSFNYSVIKLFFHSDRTFRLAHTFFCNRFCLGCFFFLVQNVAYSDELWFAALCSVIVPSEVMVVLSTFVSLSILQRNSICVKDRFFAIIFAVGLIKTVHENLVAVKLIIVLWIRNPTPWLTNLPIFFFFFSLLYNPTLKPWVVSPYMDLNSVQKIAFGQFLCWERYILELCYK